MMTSKRRSVRERKVPVKYFKEDSSDDENDDVKTKAAKLKLKEMMNADSDNESDYETDIKNGKSVVRDESSSESDFEDARNEEVIRNSVSNFKSNKVVVPDKSKSEDQSLCLSESSSDEESCPTAYKSVQIVPKKVIGTSSEQNIMSQDSMDIDDLSSQKLLELAGNLEKMKNVWNEVNEPSKLLERQVTESEGSPKKKARKAEADSFVSTKDKSADSIIKLLAAGEGVEEEMDVAASEDEPGPSEPVLPKEGVQITVALPQHMKRKKRKGFDVEAYLKRQLGRARREIALLMHKSHIVCLLGHMLSMNTILSMHELRGLALSIVPAAHSHTESSLTLVRLGYLITWLKETIPINKHDISMENVGMPDRLIRCLESLLAMNDLEFVMIFVLICRALGYNTRLVVNFNTVPMKPSNEPIQIDAQGKDNASSKISDNNSKERNSCSDQDKKKNVTSSSKSKGFNSSNVGKGDNNGGKRHKKDNVDKRKSTKTASKVSDSEGDSDAGYRSSKSKKNKKSDIIAAAKSRKSSRVSASTLKNLEEEIIKSIDEKYPTNQNVKSRTRKDSKHQSIKELKSNKESKTKNSKDSDKSKAIKESKSSPVSKKVSKSTNASKGQNYWAEVYVTRDKKWIPVDPITGKLNSVSELESKASKPMLYVLAVNNIGKVKDVTQRYASNYLTQTRKQRVDQEWVDETLHPFKDLEAEREDQELAKMAGDAPLPTSVGAFKGHPLYALQRHLLKFEAIYPPEAPTLGFIKGEPVYARECVHTLQGRTSWLKEGRVVRVGEEPYKVVKARPKWDRMTGTMATAEPLDVFGLWQTELFIPPPAKDGKVPRNEYGNVELFKPWMLPKGCVHIPINGMTRVIRKTGIDAAPAMVGWDFSGGGAHPMYDGVVVCEENADALMDAWNEEQENKKAREDEKREKRVLDNWKRLIKGLMFREKMKNKYLKD